MISPEALIGLTKMAYDGPAEFNHPGSRRPTFKVKPTTHYSNPNNPNYLRRNTPRTIGATASTGGGADYATYGGKFNQNYGRNTMQNANSSAPVQYGRNFYDSMVGGFGNESLRNMSQVPFGVPKVVAGGALAAATAVPAWAGHQQSQAINQAAAGTMRSGFNDVTQPFVRAATMPTTKPIDGRVEVDRLRKNMVNQIAGDGAYEGAQAHYDLGNIGNFVGELAAGTIPALSTGGAANAHFVTRAANAIKGIPRNARNAVARGETVARNALGRPSQYPYAKLVDPNALPKAKGIPGQLGLETAEWTGQAAANLGPGPVNSKAVAPQPQAQPQAQPQTQPQPLEQSFRPPPWEEQPQAQPQTQPQPLEQSFRPPPWEEQPQAQPPNKVVLDHSNPSAPRSPNHRGQPASLSPYIAAPPTVGPPQAPPPPPPKYLAAPAPPPAPPKHLAAPPEPAPQAPAPVQPRQANPTVGGKPTSPPAFVGPPAPPAFRGPPAPPAFRGPPAPPAPPAFVGPTRNHNPTYVSGANQYRSTNPRRGSNESKSEFEARELRRYHAALERRKARAGSYSRRTQ